MRPLGKRASEAARAAERITGTIGEVQQGATHTGTAAAQVLGAVSELARSANVLRHPGGLLLEPSSDS